MSSCEPMMMPMSGRHLTTKTRWRYALYTPRRAAGRGLENFERQATSRVSQSTDAMTCARRGQVEARKADISRGGCKLLGCACDLLHSLCFRGVFQAVTPDRALRRLIKQCRVDDRLCWLRLLPPSNHLCVSQIGQWPLKDQACKMCGRCHQSVSGLRRAPEVGLFQSNPGG